MENSIIVCLTIIVYIIGTLKFESNCCRLQDSLLGGDYFDIIEEINSL